MVQLIDGKYYIDYNDFNYLLNSGGWALRVGMKDNWSTQRHLEYISGLMNSQANLHIVFIIDHDSLKNASKIDLYITDSSQDSDIKHIQFLKYKSKIISKVIYDKEYSFVRDGDNSKFLIDGKDGSEKRGQSFYKYYPLNENSIDALTHLYVYATHPCQFNDPFDCATNLIKFDDMECIKELWGPIYQEVLAFCKNDKEELFIFTNEAYKTYLYMKCGVLCLSDNYNDLSMWSAYTGHNGFCLEFDIFSFPFIMTGPFQINYQQRLKQHNIKDISVQLATIVQTNVKQECWKQENEWRLLIEHPEGFYLEPFGEGSTEIKALMTGFIDRRLRYPIKCLKSVCLGFKFFNDLLIKVSDYEQEFIVNDKLRNDVLSFLAISRIPAYVIDVVGFGIERKPIQVYKTKENAYRILFNR